MKTVGLLVGAGGAAVLFFALRHHDLTIAQTLLPAAKPPIPDPPFVRISGDTKVYYIDPSGVAHWGTDYPTLQKITGTSSPAEVEQKFIRNIPASSFVWTIGAPIPSVVSEATTASPAAAAIAPPAAVAPIPAPAPRPAPPVPPKPAITKLGNNDPSFQSWLTTEVNTLIGPPTSTAPFRQKDIDFLKGAITNRHIPDYYKNSPGDCGAPPQLGSLGIVQAGGAVASVGVGAAQLATTLAGTAVKALPVVGAAIGVFEAAYSLAFGHHAQAVKVEQNTLCNAVPLANQFMDQLDAAYKKGQISSTAVDQNLDALQAKFLALVAAIIKPNPFSPATAKSQHTCNAACVYARALVGIIDAKKRFDY